MNKPKDTSGELILLAMMAAVVAMLFAFAMLEKGQIHEFFTAASFVLAIVGLVRKPRAVS